MPPPHVFIISWTGRHGSALDIAQQVGRVAGRVSIVYSDADPDLALDAPCELIRRPNELFWADKFKACLDACGDAAMLVIHADCDCDDWGALIRAHAQAVARLDRIGVWAPWIAGTYYELDMVRILSLAGTCLNLVALTDGIVFALSPSIVARMRQADYTANRFGWGIDLLFCAAAHVRQERVVVDESVRVRHPAERGYDWREAEQGMAQFLSRCEPAESSRIQMLKQYVDANHARRRLGVS